jgi:hypothetical protein
MAANIEAFSAIKRQALAPKMYWYWKVVKTNYFMGGNDAE